MLGRPSRSRVTLVRRRVYRGGRSVHWAAIVAPPGTETAAPSAEMKKSVSVTARSSDRGPVRLPPFAEGDHQALPAPHRAEVLDVRVGGDRAERGGAEGRPALVLTSLCLRASVIHAFSASGSAGS